MDVGQPSVIVLIEYSVEHHDPWPAQTHEASAAELSLTPLQQMLSLMPWLFSIPKRLF